MTQACRTGSLDTLLIKKNWAGSPLRILLTWLGVSLGVAVVAAVHVLDHNTVLSQMEVKRGDFGRVDLELRPQDRGTPLEELQSRLTARPELDRVGLICQATVDIRRQGKDPVRAAFFGLTPLGANSFNHYRVDGGRDLGDLDPTDRVLISPGLAADLKLQVGSRIEFGALPWVLGSRCVEGKRVPLARRAPVPESPPRATLVVAGILEPFRLALRNDGRVMVGHFNLARRFARPFAPLFQVKRAAGVDPDHLAKVLSDEFEIKEDRAALIGEAADERAFRNGVKVLGCLALALGMFVIFHTLSHSLAEKIRRVGILRSLGATQGQVSRTFLADAFLISLVGTATGLAGGILLARVLAGMEITTLGMGKQVSTFEIPWVPLMAVGAMAIFFTLLGAAFPLFKVRNLAPRRILYVRDLAPPADLMRGVNLFLFTVLILALPLAYLAMTPLLSGEGRGAGVVLFQAAGVIALFFGIILLTPRLIRFLGALPLALARSWWPMAAFLVRKNLLRSPGRLASAVCGLTLVALALLGLQSLTGSLKGEIRQFAAQGLRGHLFLRCSGLAEKDWHKLGELPGVAAVLPLETGIQVPFMLVGTETAALARPGGPLAGRKELAERMARERLLLVSKRLQHLRDLVPGSRVPVVTDAGTVEYTVVDSTDRAGFFPDERAYALVDRHWLRWDFCVPVGRCDRFSIRLAEGADGERLAELVRSALPAGVRAGWLKTGEEVERGHLHDVDRDFLFFHILLALLLLLAGLGQVNLLTLTALARSREIGVLRALGFTRGDFVKVLVLEAAVVGFIAAILTVGTGLPLSRVLVEGLERVSGLPVPYAFPWRAALLAGGLSFVISLLSALPPALRATGQPPAKAVRSTE